MLCMPSEKSSNYKYLCDVRGAHSLFSASSVKALCLADGLDIAHSKLHGNMLKQTLKHYQVDNSM